jgi:hypothetical protein
MLAQEGLKWTACGYPAGLFGIFLLLHLVANALGVDHCPLGQLLKHFDLFTRGVSLVAEHITALSVGTFVNTSNSANL